MTMDSKNAKQILCLVLLASVSAFDSSNQYQLRFSENGNDYAESVTIDVDKNFEEVNVPAHETREALGLFNDFTAGYSAKKMYDACFISKIDPELPTPRNMKQGLELSRGQFPKSRYSVVNMKTFPLRNMTIDEVGPNIAAFCKGYGLVLAVDFVKDDIDEELGIALRGDIYRRWRRQVHPTRLITEVKNACDLKVNKKALTCCALTYDLHCKWRGRHCYYYINCKRNEDVNGGNGARVCEGRHTQVYAPLCCNYVCPRDANGNEICD